MCKVFDAMWDATDPGSFETERRNGYTKGDDSTTVETIRLDKFFDAEPVRDSDKPRACACGSLDAWACWQDTKCDLVLGEARKARSGRGYVVFPDDEEVNADILALAQHHFPFVLDDHGLPPENVRDLCAFLYTAVEYMADGKPSTVFLPQHCARYLREQATPTTVSDRLLKTNNQGAPHV